MLETNCNTPQPMLPQKPYLMENSSLFISSPRISNCQEVAEYMCACNIPCHVAPNQTVAEQPDGSFCIETGCEIRFGSHPAYMLNRFTWSKLRERFGLRCGYLNVDGKFKGCIWDYFAPSACPGNQT